MADVTVKKGEPSAGRPALPPILRLHPLDADADLERVVRDMAADGAEPGTVLWADRTDRLDCAVVLTPHHQAAVSAQLIYIAMLGLRDGLAAILPPMMMVGFRLPETVVLEEAALGLARVLAPADVDPDAVPDWLAVHVALGVEPFPDGVEAAKALNVTTLTDEGCSGITAIAVLEAFARHLLSWINRWQLDGFGPVRTSWLGQGPKAGETVSVGRGGDRTGGRFVDLDGDGALMIETDAGRRTVAAFDLLLR